MRIIIKSLEKLSYK